MIVPAMSVWHVLNGRNIDISDKFAFAARAPVSVEIGHIDRDFINEIAVIATDFPDVQIIADSIALSLLNHASHICKAFRVIDRIILKLSDDVMALPAVQRIRGLACSLINPIVTHLNYLSPASTAVIFLFLCVSYVSKGAGNRWVEQYHQSFCVPTSLFRSKQGQEFYLFRSANNSS